MHSACRPQLRQTSECTDALQACSTSLENAGQRQEHRQDSLHSSPCWQSHAQLLSQAIHDSDVSIVKTATQAGVVRIVQRSRQSKSWRVTTEQTHGRLSPHHCHAPQTEHDPRKNPEAGEGGLTGRSQCLRTCPWRRPRWTGRTWSCRSWWRRCRCAAGRCRTARSGRPCGDRGGWSSETSRTGARPWGGGAAEHAAPRPPTCSPAPSRRTRPAASPLQPSTRASHQAACELTHM